MHRTGARKRKEKKQISGDKSNIREKSNEKKQEREKQENRRKLFHCHRTRNKQEKKCARNKNNK